jgi:hypothetical protein
MFKVCKGKIHFQGDKQGAVGVKYRFYVESPAGWRGEFTPQKHRRFIDGEGYTIELEDGRRGTCYIRKMVNRVMPTVPPVYSYYFRGVGRLSKPTK